METSHAEGTVHAKAHLGNQIALSAEKIRVMKRENGEVDKGLNQKGSCKVGKVLYFESNDRFKVSWFYLSFRKQPKWRMDWLGGRGRVRGIE